MDGKMEHTLEEQVQSELTPTAEIGPNGRPADVQPSDAAEVSDTTPVIKESIFGLLYYWAREMIWRWRFWTVLKRPSQDKNNP